MKILLKCRQHVRGAGRKNVSNNLEQARKSKLIQDESPTPDSLKLGALTGTQILMRSYSHDRSRGEGILLHGIRHLDECTYKMLYDKVFDSIAQQIQELESKNEVKATRRQGPLAAGKACKINTKRTRSTRSSTGKTKVRTRASSRTRKTA